MARPKVVIEDSWDAFFRDMERVKQDAEDAMRKEFGVAIGEIIDDTPQNSGQAASGWLAAARALNAPHAPIRARVAKRYDEKGKLKDTRSAAKGKKKGGYEEKRAKSVTHFIAKNSDEVAKALEYGFPVGKSASLRATHSVRNALKRLKKRFGPIFAKAVRTNVRRPKKSKKTVIQ